MSIEGAILARLKAVTAITDIVGSGSSARIYAPHLPQRVVLEAIAFRLISAPRVHAFGSDPGLVESRWQVDAWGKTYEEARDLGDAIRGNGAGNAFSRFKGTLDSTVVQDVLLDNEIPTFEDASGSFRNMQDYMIWYEE